MKEKVPIWERGESNVETLEGSKRWLVIDPCYLTGLDYPRYVTYITENGGIVFETAFGDGLYPVLRTSPNEVVVNTSDEEIEGTCLGEVAVDSGLIAVVPLTEKIERQLKRRSPKIRNVPYAVFGTKTERVDVEYDGAGDLYISHT